MTRARCVTSTFAFRGVTYSARVLAESGFANNGRVELAANGIFIAAADLSITIHGPGLGGDNESSACIYRGLEVALLKAIQP